MANNQEATLGNDTIIWNRENIEQISEKTVLVIGASGKDRRFVWKTFQDLNIKVIDIKVYDSFCSHVHYEIFKLQYHQNSK